MNEGYIYGLIDPRDDIIKYVGQTKYPLKKRYKEHLRNSNYDKTKNHKVNRWINELKSINKTPIIEKIEKVSINLLNNREKFWIKFYGNQLNNMTEGGAGIKFIIKKEFTKEHRKKIGNSCKGEKHYNYGKSAINCKKICCLNKKTGELIKKYSSIKLASIDNNITPAAISNCLSNKRNSSNNYIWIYENDFENKGLISKKIIKCRNNVNNKEKSIIINKYSIKTNELLAQYKSIKDAARKNDTSDSAITYACRINKKNIGIGFKWIEIKKEEDGT